VISFVFMRQIPFKLKLDMWFRVLLGYGA
jgi:hypothetical protein